MTNEAFRTLDGRTLEQAASDLVHREVLCCMSSMVATLAAASGELNTSSVARNNSIRAVADVSTLADQAFELAAPVLDYEEAAREAGWTRDGDDGWRHDGDDGTSDNPHHAETAKEACEAHDIEPHEIEVFEHWAVTTWFAEKLTAAGERVDTDFAGLNVWARTTTGQAIHADAVIVRIAHELHSHA